MFWTETFLERRRKEWLKAIERAEYTMDGEVYPAQITKKAVEDDRIILNLVITEVNGNKVNEITEVRLYDDNNDLAGKGTETVTKLSTQGLFTAIEVTLKEV